jgi:hypothetical protein
VLNHTSLTSSGAAQKWIVRIFTTHTRLINLIGGILLIGVGIYDFINNWELVKTYLAVWLA